MLPNPMNPIFALVIDSAVDLEEKFLWKEIRVEM